MRLHWPSLLVTAIVAAALGAGGTYLALRPALNRPARTQPLAGDDARVAAYWYDEHQDWPRAITLYKQAIAGGLDNPDIRTDLGAAYYKSGQLRDALEQYAIAQSQNPRHENSLFNQAIVYVELGNPAKGIMVWQQYLQRFPQGQHVTAARQLISQVQAHPAVPTPPGKPSPH